LRTPYERERLSGTVPIGGLRRGTGEHQSSGVRCWLAKRKRMRCHTVLGIYAAIAVTSLLGASGIRAADEPSPSATPTPNPVAIFLRSARVTRGLLQPKFVEYDLTASEDGMTLEKHQNANGSVTSYFYWTKINAKKRFHVTYRVSDDISAMTDIDTGQRSVGAPIPVNVVPATALSPFGKPPQNAAPNLSPSPGPSATSGPSNVAEKVIGEISVEGSRQYNVTFAGISDQAGVPAFHLLLRARTDNSTHPLTDLYVDTVTYRILRAVAAYSASVVIDGYKCTASIDFASAGPYWVVTDGKIEGSAHVFFKHVTGSYTFTIESPTFPTTLPDSDFIAPGATS
jgi:hypothetical protein